MIKIQDILLEVGEGTAEPYEFKRKLVYPPTGNADFLKGVVQISIVYYYFQAGDKKTKYTVQINKDLQDEESKLLTYHVSFGVAVRGGAVDFDIETNRGDVFKVMATVVAAIATEIDLDKKDGAKVTELSFQPSKTKGPEDQRRSNVYKAYVKRAYPNAKVSEYGDDGIMVTNKQGF